MNTQQVSPAFSQSQSGVKPPHSKTLARLVVAVLVAIAAVECAWFLWPVPDFQAAGPQVSAAWARATNSDRP